MGVYIYTLRAENKVIDNKTIHVAKFAGKPFWNGQGNGKIDRAVGIADRTFEKRGYRPEYFVLEGFDGEDMEVYHNLHGYTSFCDDSTLGVEDRCPCIGKLVRGGMSGWVFEPKAAPEPTYADQFEAMMER